MRAMARRATASSAGRHLLEVHRLQALGRREGQGRVDLDLLSLGLLLPGPGVGVDQGLRRAPLGRLRVGAVVEAADHRREEADHVLEELRVAPEQAEDLGEHRPLLGAADEAGLERGVEVAAVGEAHRLDGADRVDHPARADRQAGAAQRTGEVGDVVDELAVLGDRQRRAPGCTGHPIGLRTPAVARVRPW